MTASPTATSISTQAVEQGAMKRECFVNYEVGGKSYQAGPYSLEEVGDHYQDIKLFEAVSCCWIGHRREPNRHFIEATHTDDARVLKEEPQ